MDQSLRLICHGGYDLLADEKVEASLILGGSANTSVASYIINNVVLLRSSLWDSFFLIETRWSTTLDLSR